MEHFVELYAVKISRSSIPKHTKYTTMLRNDTAKSPEEMEDEKQGVTGYQGLCGKWPSKQKL